MPLLPVSIRVFVDIYVHNELLPADVFLEANGTLQVWCLVVIRYYVALQIRKVLKLASFVVLRLADVTPDPLIERQQFFVAALFPPDHNLLAPVQPFVFVSGLFGFKLPGAKFTRVRQCLLHFYPVGAHVLFKSDHLICHFTTNFASVK